MDWKQIEEMNSKGISIQSHTVSHKPLSVLSASKIKNELSSSKRSIEHILHSPVHFFSSPHGMIDQRVMEIANSLDYRGICISEPGYHHNFGIPAVFKRINISDQYDLATFQKIVQMDLAPLLSSLLSKKFKNLIKSILGYNNYRKLYRLRYRIED